ncbi:MAG TPA: choice-of-anchor V domain-containing protein [Blastocatellia bacterium]|nr:choice-of-anchor V domain-containing protein [Blastocatellia bacterium]
MSRSNRAKTVFLGLFAIGVAAILLSGNRVTRTAHASASGPIAGVTGAPSEADCTLCHNTPSGEPGEFTITAPSTYLPGMTYQITVTHVNTDDVTPRTKWGFELTALTVAGDLPVGDLQSLPKSTLTQIITGGPGGNRQYIEHTYEGGFEGQLGGASWTFTWTAPSTDMGPVRLYAAGNQADGDFDNTGDQIYLAQATINPNTCSYSLSSPSGFFSMSGGAGKVNLTTGAGCDWAAASDTSWITLTSSGNGTGSDTVTFEVRENFTSSARSGTLIIADLTYTVVQDGGLGEGCNYVISPTAVVYPPGGGSGTINVFAASGCAWQAATNAGWVSITSGTTGIGDAAVGYTVAANPGPGGRKATIAIAGWTFRIKQKSL